LLTSDSQVARTAGAEQSALPLKLLFLLPFAPDLRGSHGGARATAEIIEMLSKHHRVRVLYLDASGKPPPRQLPSNCEQLVAVPLEKPAAASRSFIERFAFWRRPKWVDECWTPLMASRSAATASEYQPDVVHHEFHVMAQYIPIVRTACPRAACIVTEHEPGIIADTRPAASLTLRQRLGVWARRRAWTRYERHALTLADAIIVFTPSDATALERLLGSSSPPVSVIPFRLPQQARSPAANCAAIQSDFLFVGNFLHPPNADAARRLVHSIFPMILRELPGARLAIVGADPPADVIAAASDRVMVTGWVDDPSIYLAGATVVLVPLRQGGGLRVKMLEACAAGKAIVASPIAIEGLSLRHDHEVVIAQSDEEFAQAAVNLRADLDARSRLEAASLRWWEYEHDTTRWEAQYSDVYARLGRWQLSQ
jgi:polysaccharide biosynthesis protein PslH